MWFVRAVFSVRRWRWPALAYGDKKKCTPTQSAANAVPIACALAGLIVTKSQKRPLHTQQAQGLLALCSPVQCATTASVKNGVHFRLCDKTSTYTPVFEASPVANTASVNVNGALLRNYARSMGNIGMKEDVYDRLYSIMVREAQAAPGKLREAPKAAASAMTDLGLVGCFSRVQGCAAEARGVTGVVFVDVYSMRNRPMNEKNVALIYVEGPNGNVAGDRGGLLGTFRPAIPDCNEFLSAVEDVAANVMAAVCEYNQIAGVAAGKLPRIEVLQYCLVSGGTNRHPQASKLDVAEAAIRGLIAGAVPESSTQPLPPRVHLAADPEGTFAEALRRVQQS